VAGGIQWLVDLVLLFAEPRW